MSILGIGSHGCVGARTLKPLVEAGEHPIGYAPGDDSWRPRLVMAPDALAAVTFVRGDITDAAIREALPGAKTLVGHDAATEVPVAGAYDDRALQRDLGPVRRAPLRAGVRETIEPLERILRVGRLDVRELGR